MEQIDTRHKARQNKSQHHFRSIQNDHNREALISMRGECRPHSHREADSDGSDECDSPRLSYFLSSEVSLQSISAGSNNLALEPSEDIEKRVGKNISKFIMDHYNRGVFDVGLLNLYEMKPKFKRHIQVKIKKL